MLVAICRMAVVVIVAAIRRVMEVAIDVCWWRQYVEWWWWRSIE